MALRAFGFDAIKLSSNDILAFVFEAIKVNSNDI